MIRLLSFIFTLHLFALTTTLIAEGATVKAVLFFSPTCPHCHDVIREHLPPLQKKYGPKLVVIGINTQTENGQKAYLAAMEKFNLPVKKRGVPALIVGDNILMGSFEIPELFPAIIEAGLAQAGIDWPAIPGLQKILEAQGLGSGTQNDVQSSTKAPSSPAVQKEATKQDLSESFTMKLTMKDKLARDPVGNSLAIVVLISMILSLVVLGFRFFSKTRPGPWPAWVIPALIPIGLGVAAYLSFVEVNQVEALCGPVGDCNAVAQSPYAKLFGIPMAILGLISYIAIALAWFMQQYGPRQWKKLGAISIVAMTFAGTLFSIYLTFLEPFVIGATCIWCLTSAVVMTLLLWASTSNLRTS